jgi:hypothetical protein
MSFNDPAGRYLQNVPLRSDRDMNKDELNNGPENKDKLEGKAYCTPITH